MKKKLNVKVLSSLLALSLLILGLAACSNTDAPATDPTGTGTQTNEETDEGTDSSDETDSTVDPGDLTTIQWYVDLPFYNFGGPGWGQDLVSKTIQEKAGVNINFQVPATDGGEQLSAMLAGGDVPDLMTIEDRNLLHQMIREDYLISYNDLSGEFSGQLEESLALRPDVYDFWASSVDGKTYGMPNYPYSQADVPEGSSFVANRAFVIRKDIYEAVGSPEVESVEDLFNLFETIKSDVGTYDGKNLIMLQTYEGVTDSIWSVSQYFATPVESETGEYVYDMTQSQFKEGMSFLNQAYRAGYITADNFSDTRDLVVEKISSGQVVSAFVAPQDFKDAFGALYDTDPEAVYMPLVVKNSQNEDPVLSDISGMGWLLTAISADSEHHEDIERLLGYLLSNEGIINMTFGIEGVTYEVADDGSYAMTDEYQAAVDAQDTDAYNLHALFLFDNYAYRSQFDPEITDERELAINDLLMKEPTTEYSYTYPTLKADPDDERANTVNELSTRMTDYRRTMLSQIIAAQDDAAFEQLYEEALATLTGYDNFETFMEYQNDAWQAGKAILGFENEVWWPNYR